MEKFIKVYVDRLRKLAKDCDLTRAEIGELLLLSLFMDESQICRPGKQTCAAQIGMASGHNARRIQRSLKNKGALRWDYEHDYGSPRYHLPGAFSFGKGISGDPTQSRGGVATETPGGSITESRGGYVTATPESDSSRTRGESRNKRNRSDSNENALLIKNNMLQYETEKQQIPPKSGDFDILHDVMRKHVMQQTLKRIGVDFRECELMVEQYPTDLIELTLREAGNRRIQSNPAGYVRRMLDQAAGPLIYPARQNKPPRPNVAAGQTQMPGLSPAPREPDYDSWVAERKRIDQQRRKAGAR